MDSRSFFSRGRRFRSFRASRILAALLTFAALTLAGATVHAFSIASVTLWPSNVVPPMTELRMTIQITTPSQGTALYASTRISTNAGVLHVDVYPTSGPLTAIGSLQETVILGVFPTGTHPYEVAIHPNFQVNWGVRTNQGSFVVNDSPNDLPVVSITAFSPVLEFCPPPALCAGISFSLRRTGPGLSAPLTVFLHYSGTATPGVDYTELPLSVTFAAGQDLAAATAVPLDDTLYEGDETIVATVVAGLDYRVEPNQAPATTILRDNEQPAAPVVSLELLDADAQETLISQNLIDWAEFRVRRTGPATDPLIVYVGAPQGSAQVGVDYWFDRVTNGSIRIPAGAASIRVRLYPIDDGLYEGDETALVQLVPPPPAFPPYAIDPAHPSVAMRIRDNDPMTSRLEIAAPRDGQAFAAGDVIELRADIITPGNNAWTIEFLDGSERIGTTTPGVALLWANAIGGTHLINARATSANGGILEASPVHITVGPGPALPVVSIVASSRKTGEPCPVCFVAPGVFTISRTGPTAGPLTVHVAYDGTATPGLDYLPLPATITIPAGTNSARVLLLALDDLIVEGPEIVRARLASPADANGGYIVSVHAPEALVVIGDDEPGAPDLRLDLVAPAEGAHFPGDTTIEISALGVWTQGEVDRPVEFFAGTTLIGRSDPVQLNLPIVPCLPSVHTMRWENAPSGAHVLTARFQRGPGVIAVSPPVNITVGFSSNAAPRVAIVQPADGAQFAINDFVEIVAEAQDSDGFVRRMEFFADSRKIGESNPGLNAQPLQTFRFTWANAAPGPHDLTVVGTDNLGARGTSAPVHIEIGMSETLPIVTAKARDARAVEPGSNSVANTATFRLRRFGPTNDALVVAYALHGTAENGVDYDALPGLATIAAGRRFVDVIVRPKADGLPEGRESVVLRVEEPPPADPNVRVINPYQVGHPSAAAAVIFDVAPALNGPHCLVVSNNLIHVCFATPDGQPFRVEASPDLRQWETLGNNWSQDGGFDFVDMEIAEHPIRFYRLTPEPMAEPED